MVWTMEDQRRVSHWIGLLQDAVGAGLAASSPGDLTTRLARRLSAPETLRGGADVTAADASATVLRERRLEIAGLLACAGALTGCPVRLPAVDRHALSDLADWLAARRTLPVTGVTASTRQRPTLVDRLIRAQAGGPFRAPDADVQPDTWWYGELVALHAVTAYAIHAVDDADAWQASRKGAAFIHAEIQPDHATALPWAIAAFVLTPGCHTTAEWVLNACMIQYGGAPTGAALVILADALYGLRHVQPPEPIHARPHEPI